jgi:hypothetical protein
MVTVLFLVSLAAVSPAPVPERAHALGNAALVDLGRGVVYVGLPSHGVEALDLGTGSSLWRTDAASLPLSLGPRGLLARGEEKQPGPRLPLVVLDVAGGGRRVFAATLALPGRVHAAVGDARGRSFRAEAWPLNGAFALALTYREAPVRGVGGNEPVGGPEWTFNGGFRIDPDAQRAEAADVESLRPLKEMAARGVAGGVRGWAEGGRGAALTLKRRDARTERALPDVVLAPKALVSLPSLDQAHLLVIERVGAGGPQDPEYRWSIFSVETGERVGELRRDVSASPFVVWKDRLLFLSPAGSHVDGGRSVEDPMTLRAVDLRSGQTKWEKVIRDLEYRGELPPQQ